MPDSFIQVAPDSTGSRLRTYSQTVNAQTVMAQVVIPKSPRTRTGLYRATDGVAGGQALLTAAHTALATTAGTGFLFLTNPVASTVAVALKRIQFTLSVGSAAAAATSPRLTLNRFQYTGTISTATLTPGKRVNTATAGLALDAAAQAKVTTTITGQTTVSVQAVRAWNAPAIITAAGIYGYDFEFDPNVEDDELILAPGEGLALQQSDAGTPTTEPRKVVVSVAWEEFSAP